MAHTATSGRAYPKGQSRAFASRSVAVRPVASAPRQLGWISPTFWMVPSLTLFCVCLVFPPSLYRDLLGDPDLIFLNWRVAAFTGLCVLSMLAGMAVFRRLVPPSRHPVEVEASPPMLTDVAMGIVLLIGNLYVLRVVQQSGLYSSYAETAMGDAHFGLHYQASFEVLEAASLSSISLISVAFMPWLYHVSLNARGRMKTHEGLVLRVLFWSLFLTYGATVAPMGRRTQLLRPIVGVFLVWFLHQCARGRMTRARVLTILSGFMAFGLCLFVSVWLARTGGLSGNVDTHELFTELVGYLIGPYNQQAALTDGVLVFDGMGKGYNWTQWFWKFPVLQNYMSAEDYLGTVPPYGVFDRLQSLKATAFEPRFTALSAFGNSFVDFRWLGFLPFFPYGLIGAWLWRQFSEGRPAGLIVYPIFAYSILEWRANLLFPPPYLGQLMLVVVLVTVGRSFETALRRR